MGSQQVFCLRWSNHQSNMLSVFDELLQQETLVDVTLACDGLSLKAHKVVLSACSPYFQHLFVQNPCKHPIVILKDIKYGELKALIDFMYKGEVNVTQEQLSVLLKTAEALKIKGLTEVTGGVNGQQERSAHAAATGDVAAASATVAATPEHGGERPRHHHRRGVAHHAGLSGARVERTLLRAAASATAAASHSPPQNLSTVDRRPASSPPPTFAPVTAHQGTPLSSLSSVAGSVGSAQQQPYLLPAHRSSGQDLRAPASLPSLKGSPTLHPRSPSAKRKKVRHHHQHHHRRRPSSEGGAPPSDAEGESSENLEVHGSPEMLETKVDVGEDDFDPVTSRLSDDEDEPVDPPSAPDTDSNQESLDNFYTSQGPSNPPSEDYAPIGEPMPAMPISLATPLSLLQKIKSPGPSTSLGMASQGDGYHSSAALRLDYGYIPKRGQPRILNEEEEGLIVKYILEMAFKGRPVTRRGVLEYGNTLLRREDRVPTGSIHCNPEKGLSNDWWKEFKKRHPGLPVRTPTSSTSSGAPSPNVGTSSGGSALAPPPPSGVSPGAGPSSASGVSPGVGLSSSTVGGSSGSAIIPLLGITGVPSALSLHPSMMFPAGGHLLRGSSSSRGASISPPPPPSHPPPSHMTLSHPPLSHPPPSHPPPSHPPPSHLPPSHLPPGDESGF